MRLPPRAVAGTVSARVSHERRCRNDTWRLTTPTEATMDGRCGCGHEVASARALFGCFECGMTCCPGCTIHLESATYCRACAGSLLETAAVHAADAFELH